MGTVAIARRFHCRSIKICEFLRRCGVDVYRNRGIRIGASQSGRPDRKAVSRHLGITKTISAERWAYIAGIFDGEGCLTKDNRANGSFTYRLVISQNGRELHEWMVDVLGTGVIKWCRETSEVHHQFVLYRQRAICDFLHGISKFCIVKKGTVDGALLQYKEKYAW